MEKMRSCPFCNGKASIGISDDEGNVRHKDYELDPYSGLCFYIKHDNKENELCPIAHPEGEITGSFFYDDRKEAIDAWNGGNIEWKK